MFRLLKEKNFRLLWLGQLCSPFGDRLIQMILVALVATRSAGSTLSLAKVMAITSLPALLLNPFAGVYVDRWDRKNTMIACDLIRAMGIVLFPWLILSHGGVPLYLGVFVVFAVATFFIPARLAMIPDLVASKDLARANALFTSSGMAGSAVILLAGALLVEWVGVAKSCWVNAASYVASALFILPVVPNRRHRKKAAHSVGLILREIVEGIEELWRRPTTRRAAGLVGLLTIGAGASFVAGTVLVQRVLGTVTKDLGFLSLWSGVGMLFGALAYGRWGTHRPRSFVLGLSFLGCGVSVWLFLWSVLGFKSGVAASAAAGLLGFWIGPVGIVANVLVHEGHPERLHGRIFSSMGVVVNLSLIVSMLAGGWLADRWGCASLLLAVGGVFASSGFLLLCYTKRRFTPS